MAKTSKGDQTRARIIRAARELFAAAAYDRVSVRKIAAAAGVDAALINHYFGGKEKLFYAVVTYTINMDEVTTMLTTTPREQLGESIIRYAEILWTIISDAILPLSEYILDPDDPHRETRIALLVSQISGVATTRYLIGMEPMASLDTETLVKTVGPTLQRYIDGDLT